MRNLKKTLALVLALAMVMSLVLVVPAGAKTSKTYTANNVMFLAFTTTGDKQVADTTSTTNLYLVGASATGSINGFYTYTIPSAGLETVANKIELDLANSSVTYIQVKGDLVLKGASGTASYSDIRVPLVDNKLTAAGMQLQAQPVVKDFITPGSFKVETNDVSGLPQKAEISATVRDLVLGDKYTAKLVLKGAAPSGTGTNAEVVIAEKEFTADADSWNFNMDFVGQDKDGNEITNDKLNSAYDVKAVDVKAAFDLIVTASKRYYGGMTGISTTVAAGVDFTGAAKKVATFGLKLDGTLPTVTPGNDATFAFKLTDYNSVDFGRLFMLITNKAGDNIALLSTKTLTADGATFVWDGTYQNANNQAGVTELLTTANKAKDGTYALKGDYNFQILNQKKLSAGTLGIVDKLDDSDDDTNYEDRFATVPFVVNEGKDAVHKVAVKFSDTSAKSLIPNGTNTAIFEATLSKPNISASFEITNKAGEYITGGSATSNATTNIAKWDSFKGVKTDATATTPVEYWPDGVYTIKVTVGDTEVKENFVIGKIEAVTSVKTVENPVLAGLNHVTEVELTIAPDTASFPEIKDVYIDNNEYFMSYVEDGKLMLFGKKETPGDEPFRTSATVEFSNSDKKVMEFNVKVKELDPSTGFVVDTTILRQKPGYVGDDNKITWKFTPEGSVGGQPTFTYVKKVGDNYVELTGDELTSAQEIATIEADGTVNFLKSGRVVVKVSALNTDKYVIICTTTEVAEDLILLPTTAELTIKLNKLAQDPSKQNRISAYARPKEVDNDTVTFVSSDANIVKLLYADETTGVATNDNQNVPTGGHPGAILGVSVGSAVITATTGAKDENGQALVKQITINVVAQ